MARDESVKIAPTVQVVMVVMRVRFGKPPVISGPFGLNRFTRHIKYIHEFACDDHKGNASDEP